MTPFSAAPSLAARLFRPFDDERVTNARHDARVRARAKRQRRTQK